MTKLKRENRREKRGKVGMGTAVTEKHKGETKREGKERKGERTNLFIYLFVCGVRAFEGRRDGGGGGLFGCRAGDPELSR